MTTKSVNLDGIKLRYFEGGKGSPIIFLHGWGGTLHSFDALKEFFLPHYRVFVLDLPGFGESGMPFEPWDVGKYKNFVLDFAQVHNLDHFILVGHSFGGRISIKMAKENPEKVKAMVLCASAGIKPKRGIKQKLLYGVAKAGNMIFKLPILNKSKDFARKILYKIARTKDYMKTSGVMRETFKKVIDEDLHPLLKSINTPTLIAWGKDDTTTPLEDAYIMNKKIKGSELKIIEGARHGVHFQQPKILSKHILDFLNKQNI